LSGVELGRRRAPSPWRKGHEPIPFGAVDRVGRATVIALALSRVVCSPFSARSEPPPSAVPLPREVRGANLRPVGDDRRGYGTSTARKTMERLDRLGVNTIAILMEGRMQRSSDRSVEVASRDELEPIRRALTDANRMGFATVLIPHIYIDDGSWRGRIAFDGQAALAEWWTSYASFIHTASSIADRSGTTVLSIGVELKAMSDDEAVADRFRRLATEIRKEYDGLLTYSANWDEAEHVAFWDAVDIAGVNGYYPLEPDPMRGAEKVGRRLEILSDRADRPVLVLEVGYRSSPLAHERPWTWPEDIAPIVDEAAQARAWAAVLSQWPRARGVRGLMVWVVPTDPDDPASEPPHGFNPLNKTAESVIARAFGGHPEHAAR